MERGKVTLEGIAPVEGNATHRPSASVNGPCDGLRDRRCQGGQESAARRKCPKRAIFSLQDGGGTGGNIGANPLRGSQRLTNDRKETFYRQPFQNQTLCHDLSSSASTSKLWEKGKARKRDRATSSLCVSNSCHLAVFNDSVGSVSKSSIELNPIPITVNRTFYDLFEDPEDCFLAVFDRALEEFAEVVVPAYEGEREWAARIRAGLGALLAFLDREPELRRLVFIEALGVGPRVLARRAEVLRVLEHAVDGGRVGLKASRELPALTAEGVVGAAFGLIHARVVLSVQPQSGSLTSLLNPLMATIVLPYRGRAAAERELSRPAAKSAVPAAASSRRAVGMPARAFRPTLRTHKVLAAVEEQPGANNRQVGVVAGVSDQGQMSRLLARLEGLGLLENRGTRELGAPYAWHLTPRGVEALRAGESAGSAA
jgi:AcrR family transcriptional regulator